MIEVGGAVGEYSEKYFTVLRYQICIDLIALSLPAGLTAVCQHINSTSTRIIKILILRLRSQLRPIMMSNLSPHLREYQSPNCSRRQNRQKLQPRTSSSRLIQVVTNIQLQRQLWHPQRVRGNVSLSYSSSDRSASKHKKTSTKSCSRVPTLLKLTALVKYVDIHLKSNCT